MGKKEFMLFLNKHNLQYHVHNVNLFIRSLRYHSGDTMKIVAEFEMDGDAPMAEWLKTFRKGTRFRILGVDDKTRLAKPIAIYV